MGSLAFDAHQEMSLFSDCGGRKPRDQPVYTRYLILWQLESAELKLFHYGTVVCLWKQKTLLIGGFIRSYVDGQM